MKKLYRSLHPDDDRIYSLQPHVSFEWDTFANSIQTQYANHTIDNFKSTNLFTGIVDKLELDDDYYLNNFLRIDFHGLLFAN